MNKFLKIFIFVSILSFSGCETFDLDQTIDPSGLPLDKLDPVYAFNYAQLNLPEFVNSANDFTQKVTRQMAMTGGKTYDNAFSPELFDYNWTTAYVILNTIKGAEAKATQNEQFFILGANRVIRCYILMTLVDMYGDIPYSEALQGNANLTPKFDKSEDVYIGVYNELNQAIADLNKTNTNIEALQERDLYYGDVISGKGNKDKWIKVANTLKLKMLNNARLGTAKIGTIDVVSELTTLLTEDNLINSIEDDFAFKYGDNQVNPNSRHPLYNNQYDAPFKEYIGNYMFWTMVKEKGIFVNGITDPRTKFYFYKQSGSLTSMDSQSLPCSAVGAPEHYSDGLYASFYDSSIKTPYCTGDYSSSSKGNYLGRDHGDNSGIPQDNDFRTVCGLYPVGGTIGDVAAVVNGDKGAKGAGIMPIMLSSFVRFIKAEIKQTLDIGSVSAKDLLEQGIRESITKTTTFISPALPGGNPPAATVVNNYVNYVLNAYDVASLSQQLEIIMKEYYIASWGNGIEPYNNYRRTGYPSNMQPTLEIISGDYFYSALYPAISANNNPNRPSNVRTRKVFWDRANLILH